MTIIDACLICGACESECPNQAISYAKTQYVIDAGKCDECRAKGTGPSCVSVCPGDAIVKA
jgi:ferredoxin